MTTDFWTWTGLALAFLATFLVSLFKVSLSSFSKISASRLIEDKDKPFRAQILRRFGETQLAVGYVRILVLIAFLVYLFIAFPKLRLWPLWFFLIAVAVCSIFFEYLPRLLNSVNKVRVLEFFLPSVRIFHVLASPLLALSRNLVEKEEREEKDEEREASDEEIETFIDEAREQGIIEKDEDELLRSVVEFGDTLVREIMTPRVNMVCIKKDSTIDNLKDLIIREKYSRIPVYKDRIDNTEGIVIAKDLLEYSGEKHKSLPIEPLIRPVVFVPESMEVAELLKEFRRNRQKMAMVVDEHGGVSGLVTMEDLVEEIVGEIQDEYDTEEANISENGPLDFTVTGDVEVEEMEELFDRELAEDDFITVSGLITHSLGRVPKKGEVLEIKGLSVEILEADDKRVRKLRMKR